tara:strand:- start:5635 stop:6297 length:663 start_codon:yes stop_codon:yes gene_type:complete
MEEIRKFHNQVKRNLIQSCVNPGDHVLDVGCGCGGDIHKWKQLSVHIDMCDPEYDSIEEAKRRNGTWDKSKFFVGDITVCPERLYNVVCYNFSIQYIFKTRELFEKSTKEISKRIKPRGLLIGCLPNSDMILMQPNFKDNLGNFMVRKESSGNGTFGEKLYVHLADTPFYKDGPKSEPIAYKDNFVLAMNKHGLELISWQPFYAFSELSKMYTCFIFQRI